MLHSRCPSHNHQVNAAERAITTFKEWGNIWDEFLPQVELMLNLLHFSRRDQNRSANEEVNGFFDYNKMPIMPLGLGSTQVGTHMAPMNIMSALPPSTTDVCASSCLQHDDTTLPTFGASTPAIAPRQPSPLMTSPC
jgi:hypothetical protein